jgi:cell division protease FtsH
MNRKVGFVLLVAMLIGILAFFGVSQVRGTEVAYSTFNTNLNAGQYASTKLEGEVLYARTKEGKTHIVQLPQSGVPSEVSQKIQEKNVPVAVVPQSSDSNNLLVMLAAMSIAGLILVAWNMSRAISSIGGGGARGMMMGERSPAKRQNNITTRLTDVAGIDEVIEEANEVVDFLKNSNKYAQMGAKVPRGFLLSGAPGTGKTLLARAIAGESNVAFYTVAGSDFVEKFVGVGASRVRALFEEAKKNAPAIIFIDELDSIARSRSDAGSGGNDEREATLNQILVEMQGFEENSGVIVIGATNRPDILDKALLRRFNRTIHVPLPDMKGRKAILEIHCRSIALDKDVDLETWARSTPGFSGDDLGKLVNDAVLMAVRDKAQRINKHHFEAARDKVVMGLKRKTIISDKDKRETAYHEAGHAVVGHVLGCDPIHKITIVPHGRALGLTVTMPEEDRYSLNKDKIRSDIAMLYGGRVAEELFNDSVSTGASDDFNRATALARQYVAEWGMSELGPMVVGNNPYMPNASVSEETAREVDLTIRHMLKEEMVRTRSILQDNADKMHKIVDMLMTYETIDRDQFLAIMNEGTQ